MSEKFRPLRVSDQLELDLAGPGRPWLEPWGGRRPRYLTRLSLKSTLSATPPGGSAWGRPTADICKDILLQLHQLELPFSEEV